MIVVLAGNRSQAVMVMQLPFKVSAISRIERYLFSARVAYTESIVSPHSFDKNHTVGTRIILIQLDYRLETQSHSGCPSRCCS